MDLTAVYDSLEDIPESIEDFRSLFTEKNGKFELTGIGGVKTEADVTRLQTSLHKAQEDNKKIKAAAKVWDGLDHDEVMAKLDRIPELEAAAKGNLDDAQVEEIVERRVAGVLNSKVAPLQRKIDQQEQQIGELTERDEAWTAKDRSRRIRDDVTKALVKTKVIEGARDDALIQAERIFEIREDDGAIVTRDNVGVTPGLDAEAWLTEIQPNKLHWWPESQGGGARGSRGGGSLGGVKNPWSAAHWNMTQQGAFVKQHGMDRAQQMAKAAGTEVGGRRPAAKQAAS